jgi:hypothetical protein
MLVVTVDLRAQFGAARDQRQRPTCMAFAASDAHAAARGSLGYLSTEFAHFRAVRRRLPFNPHSGVTFELMAQTIHEDGQPPEGIWPYLPVLPTNISEWKPPTPCEPIFRRRYHIEKAAVDRIYANLDKSQPVVLIMKISSSFFLPSPEGIINAAGSEPSVNSHAVIALGYGRNDQSPLILVRNSWGRRWGLQGHAWITEEYLRPRILKIGTAALKED